MALYHTWSAYGTKDPRVELAECLQGIFRDVPAILLIVLGAPGDMGEINVEGPKGLGQFLHYLDGGRDDFGADAIAGDGGDLV